MERLAMWNVLAALGAAAVGVWLIMTGHPWLGGYNFAVAGAGIGNLVGSLLTRRMMREVWKLP